MIIKVDELLNEYRAKKAYKQNPRKLLFKGVDGMDIYNPTAPFRYGCAVYIAARVEPRNSELSEAVFFKETEEGVYEREEHFAARKLQDPFITKVGEQYVFGGTEVFQVPEQPGALKWRTSMYHGYDIESLEPLVSGPEGMKDIRVTELKDGDIGIFTRPQGIIGGRGKIGFIRVNSLAEVTAEVMEKALILEQFDALEWGGCNEVIRLKNGKLGILGHIAKFSEGDVRHYYPMTFMFDPETLSHSDIKIIAERSDFLPGPAKREDLKDVLFSGGLVRRSNGMATLYTGVSDSEVQAIDIEDPFLEYE